MSELKAGSVQSPLPVQPIMTMGWVERGCWLEGRGERRHISLDRPSFVLRSAAKWPIDFSAPAASRLPSRLRYRSPCRGAVYARDELRTTEKNNFHGADHQQ